MMALGKEFAKCHQSAIDTQATIILVMSMLSLVSPLSPLSPLSLVASCSSL
jgi:hypothetical protein